MLPLLFALMGIVSFLYFDTQVAYFAASISSTPMAIFRLFSLCFAPAVHIIGSFFAALYWRYSPLILYAVAQIGAGTLVQIGKKGLGRARPMTTSGYESTLFDPFTMQEAYASFPSGHATVLAIIGTVAASYMPKYKAIIYLGVVALSSIRVMQLKHFVSDVCFGLALGFAVGNVVVTFASRILDRAQSILT